VRVSRFVVFIAALSLSACVDRLPDQDLRILDAAPSTRLSADLLWKDYKDNAAQADRTYKGKAVVITGTVRQAASPAAGAVPAVPVAPVVPAAPGTSPRLHLDFPQNGTAGIVAYLLDEQAADLVASAAVTPRMTIKCFVQGIEGGSPDVILKSCIKP
jgi:tRNA_anti-like